MVAIVGDVHIKLRQNKDWERLRIRMLADSLIAGGYSHIIINGDLLDNARPTLLEVAIAQEFIELLSKVSVVYLINGNHESVDVASRTSTYDYIHMPHCKTVTVDTLTVEGCTFRLVSWSFLKRLTHKVDADILVTHVRSALPPHIDAERDMEFLNDYDLCILSDIHSKYSPHPNTHYTNSPYAVSFNSSSPDGSYIIVNPSDKSWEYVDLDLPQKVRLKGNVGDFIDFKPEARHLYKIVVEGTIEELRKLRVHTNVSYTKVIERIEVDDEELPENTELLDLLVDKVCEINNYTSLDKINTKTFIKEVIE